MRNSIKEKRKKLYGGKPEGITPNMPPREVGHAEANKKTTMKAFFWVLEAIHKPLVK